MLRRRSRPINITLNKMRQQLARQNHPASKRQELVQFIPSSSLDDLLDRRGSNMRGRALRPPTERIRQPRGFLDADKVRRHEVVCFGAVEFTAARSTIVAHEKVEPGGDAADLAEFRGIGARAGEVPVAVARGEDYGLGALEVEGAFY